MTDVDVIGQRGASLLIRVDADTGRIFDRRHRRLFPPQSIESALARGYWERFTGDVRSVADELSRAQEVEGVHETPNVLTGNVGTPEVDAPSVSSMRRTDLRPQSRRQYSVRSAVARSVRRLRARIAVEANPKVRNTLREQLRALERTPR
jgi:hypothetical protein